MQLSPIMQGLMWFVTAFPNTLICPYRVSDFRAEAEKSHRAFEIARRAQGMPGLRALDHYREIRRRRDVGHPENEPEAADTGPSASQYN